MPDSRSCTRVVVEYNDGSTEIHEVDGGDLVVATSGPETIAHAKVTVGGMPERIAQLICTALLKIPELLKPFMYYLNNDLKTLRRG